MTRLGRTVATRSRIAAANLRNDKTDDGRGVWAARLELCCIVSCFFELMGIVVAAVLASFV